MLRMYNEQKACVLEVMRTIASDTSQFPLWPSPVIAYNPNGPASALVPVASSGLVTALPPAVPASSSSGSASGSSVAALPAKRMPVRVGPSGAGSSGDGAGSAGGLDADELTALTEALDPSRDGVVTLAEWKHFHAGWQRSALPFDEHLRALRPVPRCARATARG